MCLEPYAEMPNAIYLRRFEAVIALNVLKDNFELEDASSKLFRKLELCFCGGFAE